MFKLPYLEKWYSLGMNSDVKAIMKADDTTDSLPMISKILYQIPIFLTRCATGRRIDVIIFFASKRISNRLLICVCEFQIEINFII